MAGATFAGGEEGCCQNGYFTKRTQMGNRIKVNGSGVKCGFSAIQNRPKRSQNEANFERRMRALGAKSGFLETSPNRLVRFSAKQPNRARFRASLGMTAQGKNTKSWERS